MGMIEPTMNASITASEATCGDGVVWFLNEECDDGNLNNDGRCSRQCTEAVLRRWGDLGRCGAVTMVTPDNRDECLTTGWWLPPVVTARFILAGEDCDDGNGVNKTAASPIAHRPFAVTALCAATSEPVSRATKQCDDGNRVDSDGCTNDCTLAACGDGILLTGEEACDDGNRVDTDAQCRNTCQIARRGDGVVNPDMKIATMAIRIIRRLSSRLHQRILR